VDLMRRPALAEQSQAPMRQCRTTHKHAAYSYTMSLSHKHTRKPTAELPLNPQQHTFWYTPSKNGHVPNRCSCKLFTSHTELSRRPCSLRSGNAADSARRHGRNKRIQQAARSAWAARRGRHWLSARAWRWNCIGGGDRGMSDHDEPSQPISSMGCCLKD
jgi:hypothetical protein